MQAYDPGLTNREKIILQELSADSRASLTSLAKAAGCSAATTNKLLDRLVERLDVRFTLEIDMDKLGLAERHIITVKFAKKPDDAVLSDFFKNDAYAQDVYKTKGDFDLLVFAAADTPGDYLKWETDLAIGLSDYLPELRPSEFVFPHLGYMPLNSSFVNFVGEEMKIDSKDRRILEILNSNARTSYRKMSERLGINEDTVRYRVFKLQRKGIIRRFTVAVQNAQGCLAAYLVRYRFDKYTVIDDFPQMRAHYKTEYEDAPLINSSPFIVVLSGSYRLFGMSFGKSEEDAERIGPRWHRNLLKGNNPRMARATVVKAIRGVLPLRNLDAKKNYRLLWT
ncbi:MAG: Lrp/AsnC family transcriptional regulator [Candidatus Micrarchaeota archaeon]|nr:Lrp/AsnC family transcriptional regulator [Candidatus Micrarchaeota archaeon]